MLTSRFLANPAQILTGRIVTHEVMCLPHHPPFFPLLFPTSTKAVIQVTRHKRAVRRSQIPDGGE